MTTKNLTPMQYGFLIVKVQQDRWNTERAGLARSLQSMFRFGFITTPTIDAEITPAGHAAFAAYVTARNNRKA